MMANPFSAMVKPVGSLCNLNCEYCYYLGTDELIGATPARVMDDGALEIFIQKYISACESPVVPFTWHGGEPTLAGLDFYRKVVRLQKKYLPEGARCVNNLQTNGILLTDEWCDFIAAENFDVGLSIDGSQAVHDKYRRDASGAGSYARVRAAAERLTARGVKPDLLCTVTGDSAEAPLEVYRALKALNTGWMQFIPIIRRDNSGGVTPDSVTPEGYGYFLKRIFDEWITRDAGKTGVQLFAETALIMAGGEPSLCWMRPTCGRVLIVERDGGVYSCDHFVTPENRLGSALTDDLRKLANSQKQIDFGNSKRDALTEECKNCRYLKFCGGGCPKDRFASGKYYLCDGLKAFFEHAEKPLTAFTQMRKQGVDINVVMARLRNIAREKWKNIGRNDPCPCGSGKKAKNCCWETRP